MLVSFGTGPHDVVDCVGTVSCPEMSNKVVWQAMPGIMSRHANAEHTHVAGSLKHVVPDTGVMSSLRQLCECRLCELSCFKFQSNAGHCMSCLEYT